MLEYLNIGKIINSHGIRGEVKVLPLTDDIRRYEKLEFLFVDFDKELKKYFIENIKYHKKFVLLKLKGIENKEDVDYIKDRYIKIHRKDAIKLKEGSFFICDLIGCSVYDDNTDNLLGKVIDIIETGSNDVYIVKGEDSKELLVPALKSVVKDVCIQERIIKVVLPEGLV